MAYTKIKNFKFWCQKVLPLVYDDSLSYYEVLCKIRDYINEIIANMDELASLIEDLDSRVDALEDELEHISQSIIEEIKEYLGTDEFISQLVEALGESETFNNWFKEFLTNNEEVIRDLINSDYFDQYFKDYFTNNSDLIQQLLNSDAFSQYFQTAFGGTTDFYDTITVAGDNISAGGLTSNFYAIGRESQIETGTRLKLMYAPDLTPIVGKFEVSESGGFYRYTSDGDTNYTSFIIDMTGYSGRNLYFYIAESFDPFSLILVKRGSLDTGGQAVTSDKSSTIQQVAYVPGTWTSNWVATTKKVNYAIVSIKNNGVAFNPIFTYSIKNVDYDANTDNPIMVPHNIYAVWNGASDTAISSLELYKPKNDLGFIIFGMLGSTQYGINEEVNVVDSNVSNMQEDIDELKNSVSDGKAQVASAITDKGVATASDATFDTMATNIRNIQTERAYPNGFFKKDSLTDITNDILTVLPNDYGFTNIDMLNRSWRIYDDLLDAGFNVHSFTETSETAGDTVVTYRTFRLSPPSVNDIGYIFSYTDFTLTSIKRYAVNYYNGIATIFSTSSTRFLIKKVKNSYCIINFINDAIPTDYFTYLHFLSDAYDSNGVLFGCLFDYALNTGESFNFSVGGDGAGNVPTGQSQVTDSNALFIQKLYASGNNTGDLVRPFYIDSLYDAAVMPTPRNHSETYIFKSTDGYEFLLLGSTNSLSKHRPIRIK